MLKHKSVDFNMLKYPMKPTSQTLPLYQLNRRPFETRQIKCFPIHESLDPAFPDKSEFPISLWADHEEYICTTDNTDLIVGLCFQWNPSKAIIPGQAKSAVRCQFKNAMSNIIIPFLICSYIVLIPFGIMKGRPHPGSEMSRILWPCSAFSWWRVGFDEICVDAFCPLKVFSGTRNGFASYGTTEFLVSDIGLCTSITPCGLKCIG